MKYLTFGLKHEVQVVSDPEQLKQVEEHFSQT